MASAAPVQKPIQRVLDPTKIGTWNLVRRPPVDQHTLIQGKPRNPGSNAFKEHQAKEGARLRKALNYLTHGRNIFVYHNLQTNQVVYSLTRYLEKNNVLRQLIFHGKKTVPATLRKDLWVPYYSIHFNDSQSGLRAYHLLREFSLQRQLAPPRDMITITEDFLKRKRPLDPEEAEEFDEKHKESLGKMMERRDRARAVMDQKATSVADIAAVLEIEEEERQRKNEGEGNQKGGPSTKAGLRRQRIAKKKEKAYAAGVASRVANFEKMLSTPDAVYKVEPPQVEKSEDGAETNNRVKVLWTDVQDAHYAQQWPERVRHGELDQTRDHVMPGQKSSHGPGVLAEDSFNEKKAEQ